MTQDSLLGPNSTGLARALGLGALLWGGYAVLTVLVNGVVLDEVIKPGQIITGMVQYPAGHPHEAYYKGIYSLLHYVAAGFLAAVPSVTAVAAVFNVAFLFSTAFVPFAFTLLLTERPMWGYVASTLALSAAFVHFKGLYPLYVFPDYFSNGHVGLYLGASVVALLLFGAWRAGAFALGLLPAVHGAMALLVWPWAAAFLAFARIRPVGRDRRRATGWFLAGLAVCVALAVVIALQYTPPPLPPYDSVGDADLIYRQFTLHTDTHRKLFSVRSFGYLTNPIAFFVMGALALWGLQARSEEPDNRSRTRRLVWTMLFGVLVWGIVYGAWAYRVVVGPLPKPIEIAMPFRFGNFTAVLLIPLTVSALANMLRRIDPVRRTTAVGVLALLLLGGAAASVFAPDLVARNLLTGVWGLTLAVLFLSRDRLVPSKRGALAGVALTAGLLALAPDTWAGLYLVAAFIGSGIVMWLAPRASAGARSWLESASGLDRAQIGLAAACVLASLIALRVHGSDQTWKSVSPYDRTLSAWLDTHATPNEMLVVAVSPWSQLQPKTGHPTLIEWETLYILAYSPQLSPRVRTIVRDVFAIDYQDPDQLEQICEDGRVHQWCPAWLTSWQSRLTPAWQALGAKYDFRLVLAPTTTTLQLPVALPGSEWTLYTVPPATSPLSTTRHAGNPH